jgi:hypothetical protein
MILEPKKSAEDIDRRLAALTDAELAELLASLNREFHDNEPESYASPSAPYWKKRIALVALAGLMALSAGFSAAVSTVRERPAAAPKHVPPVAALPHHRASALPVRHKIAPPVPAHRAAAPLHAALAPVAPAEAVVRRARTALLHEQALAAQAQAEARAQAAQAHHQAQIAMQARAEANAQALREALAKARAQARAEAIAQARAQALANAQAQQLEAAQQQALYDNARDPNIKPGSGIPPAAGGMSTIPNPNNPAPAPGPVLDPNCTPHRGAFFGSVLDNVRVGGTNVGAVLRLIHHP